MHIISNLIMLGVGFVCGYIAGNLYGKKKYKKVEVEDDIEDEFKRGGLKKEKTPLDFSQTIKNSLCIHSPSKEMMKFQNMYMIGDDPAEIEHPEDDTPERDNFIKEREKNKNKPPKIISAEAVGELPAYIENKVLYLYNWDETVVDDEENVIDHPEELLGDCLEQYDFYDSDERIIFVMNYSLDTCYEIQKVDASWEDVNE